MPVQQAKQIAEDLLQWIKALGFDRHKLIIQVPSSYSDKNGQSMRASSLANRSSAPSKNVLHIQTSYSKPSRNAYEDPVGGHPLVYQQGPLPECLGIPSRGLCEFSHVQVSIGQKCGQAQRSRSWCLWDVRTDGAASETYENESMFCICQVRKRLGVMLELS